MALRAKKEEKARILHIDADSCNSSGATPNIATSGYGSNLHWRTTERVLNIDRQKCSSLGHVQNMCIKVPSAH